MFTILGFFTDGGGGVANLQRHLRVWSLWSNCNEGGGGVEKGPKTVVDLCTQHSGPALGKMPDGPKKFEPLEEV